MACTEPAPRRYGSIVMLRKNSQHAGFALIELLVVVAVLALLVSILLPSLSSAKELAKVVRVRAELRGIATALECYAEEHERTYPPQRTYCESEKWEHFCELPIELVEGKWLPAGQPDTKMSANIEDIFNPGHTYKYKAPGWGFHNDGAVPKSVWVPDDFPNDDPDADPQTLAGTSYDNVWVPTDAAGKLISCPVSWVIWSVGPRYDPNIGVPPRAPVARCSWYRGFGTEGVITCVRAADGQMHKGQ